MLFNISVFFSPFFYIFDHIFVGHDRGERMARRGCPAAKIIIKFAINWKMEMKMEMKKLSEQQHWTRPNKPMKELKAQTKTY